MTFRATTAASDGLEGSREWVFGAHASGWPSTGREQGWQRC